MGKLFERAVVFNDIHYGLKSNSDTHNIDCNNYIRWLADTAEEQECETCIFQGDYFNNRATINVKTLDYALNSLEYLSIKFRKIYWIIGNHDLYYRDSRDVHSVSWARNIDKVEIIDEIKQEGDCAFVPWLVGNDHKKLSSLHGKYLFGHLELPNFMMNAMVRMPEVGEIRAEHLSGVESVFSGHFHKRQQQINVTYVGNCFPHNFSDVNDNDRGLMILPWGEKPEFKSWPDAPRYSVCNLTDLVQNPDELLAPHSYVRVNLDMDLSYEEASYIREEFVKQFDLREISLMPINQDLHSEDLAPGGEIHFESVNDIVTNQISAIKSDSFDTNLLLNIYNNL